ncbi:intercellular adhesion molecule 1-like isoform X1 [Thamnophis elegans]|uniref:intercellular adhesion molecule 1-like isoform X1 n=1 Tax=Thamnophis elegans TaxID=35005 RepID=UPI001378F1E0|nr:intercellular adhesion molecule 1-like isoform X1 [Thamnophis elegans]
MQKFIFFFAVGAWAVTQGTAEEDYVEIWPPNPLVEFGGSLDLNCTSTCEHIGIESAYTKVPIGNGSNWKSFRLSNVNFWAASPLCYAECKTGQKKSPKANIIIYKSPASIKLFPVPDMEVNETYELTCWVLGVAPIRDLTVTFLKGEEQLLIETFEDHPWPEADAVEVNHIIKAQKDDYNKTITCQTSLDLRPRGPLLKNTSQGISLWTFDFQKYPLLHAGLFLEAGTSMKVTCDTPEVSPAEEAIFGLWFAGKPLTFNTTVMGDLASAQAVIASSSVGEHQLLCSVSLGPVAKNVTKMVNVFDRPQIDDSKCPHALTWKEGSTTSFTCSAMGNPTPTVQCWKDGRPYNIGEPQLVQREHGGIYHCNATNQYGFDVRHVTVHVESPQSIGHIIGYIVAVVVFIALVAGIAYWISYKQKIGVYRLRPQKKQQQPPQTAQNSAEQRFLNGKANV